MDYEKNGKNPKPLNFGDKLKMIVLEYDIEGGLRGLSQRLSPKSKPGAQKIEARIYDWIKKKEKGIPSLEFEMLLFRRFSDLNVNWWWFGKGPIRVTRAPEVEGLHSQITELKKQVEKFEVKAISLHDKVYGLLKKLEDRSSKVVTGTFKVNED